MTGKHHPEAQVSILLGLLLSRGPRGVSRWELLARGIRNAAARVYELREDGHLIETVGHRYVLCCADSQEVAA